MDYPKQLPILTGKHFLCGEATANSPQGPLLTAGQQAPAFFGLSTHAPSSDDNTDRSTPPLSQLSSRGSNKVTKWMTKRKRPRER